VAGDHGYAASQSLLLWFHCFLDNFVGFGALNILFSLTAFTLPRVEEMFDLLFLCGWPRRTGIDTQSVMAWSRRLTAAHLPFHELRKCAVWLVAQFRESAYLRNTAVIREGYNDV